MKTNSAVVNEIIQLANDTLINKIHPICKFNPWMSAAGKEKIAEACQAEFNYQEAGTNGTTRGTILSFLVHKYKTSFCIDLMTLFIDAGADMNVKILMTHSSDKHTSPTLIQYALTFERLDVVDLLRAKGANFLSLSDESKTVLHYSSRSYEFFDSFVRKLPSEQLRSLIAINRDNKDCIFNYLLELDDHYQHAELLRTLAADLYQSSFLEDDVIIKAARNALRERTFQHFLHTNKCVQIRSTKLLLECAALWMNESKFTDLTQSHAVSNMAVITISSEPLKIAIKSFINDVFANERNLKHLLEILSSQLTHKIKASGKHPDFHFLSQAFSVQVIGRYIYPIPTIDFKKTEKDKILPQLLIEILNTEGLAQTASKWYGFVPEEVADARVAKGEFFIESQFGLSLLHGKYSHMIQWTLMVLAVQQGIVKLPGGVTVKQVITSLVAKENKPRSDISVWQLMLDTSVPKSFRFTDPYRVTSLISTGYFGHGCKMLEVYLRDSFCADFLQWYHVYNDASRQKVDMKFFVKLLHLIPLNIFLEADIFFKASKRHTEAKLARAKNGEYTSSKRMTLFNKGIQHIITEKNYAHPASVTTLKL